MDLLFDCGNTRLKWVLVDASGNILDRGDAPDFQPPTLPAGLRPDRVAIASVRDDEAFRALDDWAGAHFPDRVRRLRTPAALGGVSVAYAEPERLGVDRWLAILAAWRRCGEACLVVDCGTAMTLDLVDGRGCHLGGAIVPGMALMVESLLGRASRIRPRPDDLPSHFPGRDTGSSVRGGVLLALRGAVREALREAGLRGVEPRLVVTGGAADALMEGMGDTAALIDKDLVFHGMREMLACSG